MNIKQLFLITLLCYLINPIFGQIILYPGQNLQNSIDSFPAGTTFIIRGTHRTQTINAREGDTYLGELGPNGERLSTMKGSKVISGWQSDTDAIGTYWFIPGVIGQNTNPQYLNATCLPGFNCKRPEHIFEDGLPMVKVDGLSSMTQLDHCVISGDTVYIRKNPAGHLFEASVNKFAIRALSAPLGSGLNGSSNVTIKHLIVEYYANPAQHGAIHAAYTNQANIPERNGKNWLIENVETRYNNGAGIYVYSDGKILNNYVHHNGQIGLKASGANVLVEGNDITANGTWGGYDWGWEGGGTKFVNTQNITIRNNYSHDNRGPGLWTDIDNIGSLYEYNLVENNTGPGIFHEISDSAIIRCNTLRYNYNENSGGSYYGGNIFISNSSNVEVYHNYTLSGSVLRDNGVILICSDRTSPISGLPMYLENNTVYENDINFSTTISRSGARILSQCNQEGNNVFRDNYYHSVNPGFAHFTNDNGSAKTLPAIQTEGFDLGSTISSYQPGTPPINFPGCSNVPPTPSESFCQSTTNPVIDGFPDCSWQDVNEVPVTNMLKGAPTLPSDFSGFYKAKWDNNRLYFLIEVLDDFLVNDTPGATPWHNDGVELFIDGDNSKDTIYGANDHQLIFAYNENTVFHHSEGTINPAGIVFEQTTFPGGYRFEIQVDWASFVGIVPAPGDQIGFDLQINDDDDGGVRENKLTFTQLTVDNSFNDPSLFGIAEMNVAPCNDEGRALDLQVFLEGCYDATTGQMTTVLNTTRALLPGMSANPNDGQPYNTAPWNYTGTEGAGWTDANYTADAVDWVLVALRTGIPKSTEVFRIAGVLLADGQISFPEGCLPASLNDPAYYIVIEHRNHLVTMSPVAVALAAGVLRWDFRAQDSYNSGASGQKQLDTGVWGMFAGDGEQVADVAGHDINGADKTLWSIVNGNFNQYINSDFNFDGDVSGADRLMWLPNNGVFSGVPK